MAKSAGQQLTQAARAAAYPKLVKALEESMTDVAAELNAAGSAAVEEHPTLKAKARRLVQHTKLLHKLGEINGD